MSLPLLRVLCVLLITTSNLAADWDDDYTLEWDYVKSYGTDTIDLIRSPICWSAGEWQKAALIGGITTTLLVIDSPVNRYMANHQGANANHFFGAFHRLGKGVYYYPALGLLYGYGAVANDSDARAIGLISIESALLSGLIVQAVKYTLHRNRPKEEPDSYRLLGPRFHGPGLNGSHLGCPSGDTAAVFAIGTVVARAFADNFWIPKIAYTAATLVGAGRVYGRMHSLSDVFIGAVIGYYVADRLFEWHAGGCPNQYRWGIVPCESGVMLELSKAF